MKDKNLPVVALTLGDAAGIGPELIARLLSQPGLTAHANIVLLGDAWLWQDGQTTAGLAVATQAVNSLACHSQGSRIFRGRRGRRARMAAWV